MFSVRQDGCCSTLLLFLLLFFRGRGWTRAAGRYVDIRMLFDDFKEKVRFYGEVLEEVGVCGDCSVRLTNEALAMSVKEMTTRTGKTIFVGCNSAAILSATATSSGPHSNISFFPLDIRFRRGVCSMKGVPNNFGGHRKGTSRGTVLASHMVSHPVEPLFPGSCEGSIALGGLIVSISPRYHPRVITVVNATLTIRVSSVPFSKPYTVARVKLISKRFVMGPSRGR